MASVEKTRIGLTELHAPREPRVDFVFVHGLRGGSFKTWRKHDNTASLWPKSWIPLDPDFAGVRTSTFGYQSDWLSRQDTPLNVHDFGRKLFNELETSSFLRRPRDTPIVLIGHSMGGIVIKQAYMYARNRNTELATRIKSIVFLATPHRGSDSADLLHNILEAAGQEKKYVENLQKHSPSLQLINDTFRDIADDVELWSFHEERRMRTGMSSDFIVDRDSATLGYKGENVFSLDANHREICKFDSSNDANYITLRNTLATIVDKLVGYGSQPNTVKKVDQMRSISVLLNVFDIPKDDVEEQERLKTPGTCQWIENKANYLKWLDIAENQDTFPGQNVLQPERITSSLGFKNNCRMFWLTAQPGTGKSVCSAHVVTSLLKKGYECCYFFFRHSGKSKALLSSMLRSIAFQMADLHAEVRSVLYQISLATVSFDKDDEVAIWNHIFMGSLFKSRLRRPQFWILDALDECSSAVNIFRLLKNLELDFALRIFVTSRPKPEFTRGLTTLTRFCSVTSDSIISEDTSEDMKLYLSSHGPWLDDGEEEGLMSDRLLSKSNGCFLWIKLVHQELEGVYSQESIESVLDEIPSGMWALYERALIQMASLRDKRLAHAMLMFSVSAVRPLKLSELQIALKMEGIQHRDLRSSVEGLCSGLLYVDRNDCVQLVHSTVRDFLFSKDISSEYALKRDESHERLAKICLKYMETEMRPPRSRSFGAGLEMRAKGTPAFAQYAATAFSEHVAASSSTSDSLLMAIAKFLRSSILAWVEHIASKEPSLYCLTRTAKNFVRYLERRAKYVSPLGDEFKLIQDWATDLIRLVAKFGRNLREQPSSIFFLIPSISPKESRLYECSRNNPTWLKMYGGATNEWDDCLAFIEYRETYATALVCGQSYFAIGMKNGLVTVYDHSTCQEKITVTHRSHENSAVKQANMVKLLAFGSSDEVFASCGLQSICVWSSTGEILHLFTLNEPQVAMTFSLDSDSIITVTRSSRVNRFELTTNEGELVAPTPLYKRSSSGNYKPEGLQLPRQAPLAAAISPDQTSLALLFRGKPIYLYNLEDDTLLGTCGRDAHSSAPNISVLTALFHPNPDVNILAVTHQDGDLVLFDPWTQKELKSVYGDAYSLAASPSGQFLGTGNTGGTLRIWTFESLELLYVIRCGLEEIRSLAFTGDGMRIVDRRDSRIKVWEPSALVRQSTAEDDIVSLSDTTTLDVPDVGENEEEITNTVLSTGDDGRLVFAGRSDGSIAIHDAESGSQTTMIASDAGGDFIVAMSSGKELLAVGDSSQTVTVFKLSGNRASARRSEVLFKRTVAEPVQQLAIRPSEQHVLIVTSESDSLWDLWTKQIVKTYSYEKDTVASRRRWTSIGTDIIALSIGEDIRLYEWSTLEQRQSVQLTIPTIQTKLTSASRAVKIVTLSISERHLVAALIPQDINQSQAHVVVWVDPFRADTSERKSTSLTADLDLPLEDVRYFLGVYQDKVVFLDHDLWICSFDLSESHQAGTKSVHKHIFIPADLVGSLSEAKPIITCQGRLVFSKAGNLAIIQGALEWDFS